MSHQNCKKLQTLTKTEHVPTQDIKFAATQTSWKVQ